MSSISVAGDTSGTITLQAPAVAGSAVLTLPAVSGTVLTTATGQTLTAPVLGTPASGDLSNCTGVQYTGFKNRIYNGGMAIDQRNAGASIVGTAYAVDRFSTEDGATVGVFSSQQVSDAPTGFIKSLKLTATTGTGVIGAAEYVAITQQIEGYNVADLAFGTASASSVTVSFWVKATTIGTYSCTIFNSANIQINPQPFTINVANTWEQKTIPFTGSTSGVWLTDNGRGIVFNIYMALGTNYQSTAGWNGTGKYGVTGSTNAFVTTGNTFQITGVQLEKGSTATSFDYRPYGTELALCQRYYERWAENYYGNGYVYTSGQGEGTLRYAVQKRAAPSVSGSGTFAFTFSAIGYTFTAPSFDQTSINSTLIYKGGMSALPSGQAGRICNSSASYLEFSAEL